MPDLTAGGPPRSRRAVLLSGPRVPGPSSPSRALRVAAATGLRPALDREPPRPLLAPLRGQAHRPRQPDHRARPTSNEGAPVMTSVVTVEGNLTADPRLHYTPAGKAVANLRIAVSARRKDRTSGEYQDTPPLFVDVTVWGPTAENAVESLHTGDRVLVTGSSYLSTWTDAGGELRTSYVLDA